MFQKIWYGVCKAHSGMADVLHILVVDDDRVACDLLKESLVAEGYRVTIATDGMEALERIRENTFQLVITDFAMSRLDGLGLLTESKRLVPDLQVILMTASRDEQVLNEAVRRGAYVVISKPLRQMEIVKIVHEVFQRQQVNSSEWKPVKSLSLKRGGVKG